MGRQSPEEKKPLPPTSRKWVTQFFTAPPLGTIFKGNARERNPANQTEKGKEKEFFSKFRKTTLAKGSVCGIPGGGERSGKEYLLGGREKERKERGSFNSVPINPSLEPFSRIRSEKE